MTKCKSMHVEQELQHDLGLEVDSFDNIGMSASNFLWEIAQKEDNNNQEYHVAEEENYLNDHHYEQERFTDRYDEYL